MSIGTIMFFSGIALIATALLTAVISLITSVGRKKRLEEYLDQNYGQD